MFFLASLEKDPEAQFAISDFSVYNVVMAEVAMPETSKLPSPLSYRLNVYEGGTEHENP